MSWVEGADQSPFGVHHLPYGVFSTDRDPHPRIGARIGDFVLDLRALAAGSFFLPWIRPAFHAEDLREFMAAGPAAWRTVRRQLTEMLADDRGADRYRDLLVPLERTRPHLPFAVADFVDFYSSEHHAANLGKMFRPGSEPLLPNWKSLPVGYHGRAGTVVPSGTAIHRPGGQRKGPDGIEFGPSRRLDIEAEVGFVVGVETELGVSLPPEAFTDHVFGVVLVNDWSARDIQAWEYQPLGPFLGKSFATSISHWVTPLEALARARTEAPAQDPAPPAYLTESDRFAYDITLSVALNGTEIATPPFAAMYWTPAQQLAHLTAGGASVRTGDLFASGTVSGPDRSEWGSLQELTWGGAEPITLADGSRRTFLEDGDTVTIAGTAPGPDGASLALGEVTGQII